MLTYSDSMLQVMKNVVQSLGKFKKNTAIELRKKGFSYSEIGEKLKVPKSALSLWLKKIKLNDFYAEKLKNRQLETAKENARKRILKTSAMIEEIKKSSAKDIKEITKRELWLMGIILYWKERLISGSENDIRNGVGGIGDGEIKFDIFLKSEKKSSLESVKEAIIYWSKVTGFAKDNFLNHIYFQKNSRAKSKPSKHRKITKKADQGLLRIRVKSSSMLARQIAGWMKGIQDYYWG